MAEPIFTNIRIRYEYLISFIVDGSCIHTSIIQSDTLLDEKGKIKFLEHDFSENNHRKQYKMISFSLMRKISEISDKPEGA